MVARRVEGVEIERAADEILALKEGSLEAHALNQSAAAVYELCDGNTSKFEMAARFIAARGFPSMRRSWTWPCPNWSRPGS